MTDYFHFSDLVWLVFFNLIRVSSTVCKVTASACRCCLHNTAKKKIISDSYHLTRFNHNNDQYQVKTWSVKQNIKCFILLFNNWWLTLCWIFVDSAASPITLLCTLYLNNLRCCFSRVASHLSNFANDWRRVLVNCLLLLFFIMLLLLVVV